ncbi:MAG: redoxin domain-containing protein [Pirellulaceae bacterium]|nr:redoxin domain-containing protein [Pirellulaceae bacterium]
MNTESDESCPLPARGNSANLQPPRWMFWTLTLAGIYNLAWGAAVIVLPSQPFAWLAMEPPNYPQIWQCVGMVVGVYGVGYLIAARDPARHWPIVLVGWLGKVLGPIGFVQGAIAGTLPWSFGIVNVFNDLIWWVPFTAILYHAWRTNSAPAGERALSLHEAMATIGSQYGRTLADLSAGRSVLVVFIRHAGCTFCREALADLAAARPKLEAARVRIAIVHMSSVAAGAALFNRYGLGDLDQFSDPGCRLFRAFELSRGTLGQVLGPAAIVRGLPALLRHGIGKVEGDGFQLGGAFVIKDSQILAAVRHRTSADRADFAKLAGVLTTVTARQSS